MEELNKYLKENPLKLLIAAFILGGVYAKFEDYGRKFEIVERRLDKKIVIINDLEKRLRNLESCK